MMLGRHRLVARVAAAMVLAAASVVAGLSPARAARPQGCRLVAPRGRTATCAFVATTPDEVLVAGSPHWGIRIQRGGDVYLHGEGGDPTCFLEGAAGTGGGLAMCTEIRPGDSVSAWVRGGALIIGDFVCGHDPLCRPAP